jgi:hypothetical protein
VAISKTAFGNPIEIFCHPEYENVKHQELPGKPGTATWRWRRQGAFSETRVSEDVIFASTEINRKIFTVNN